MVNLFSLTHEPECPDILGPAHTVRRPQSKKRGLSLDEKKKCVLDIFHETKEVFSFKDVEKLAVKRGVTQQSVKEVVQVPPPARSCSWSSMVVCNLRVSAALTRPASAWAGACGR